MLLGLIAVFRNEAINHQTFRSFKFNYNPNLFEVLLINDHLKMIVLLLLNVS